METFRNFLLCSFAVVMAQAVVTLESDIPYLRVQRFHSAELKCCYQADGTSVEVTWIKYANHTPPMEITRSDHVTPGRDTDPDRPCGTLTIEPADLEDAGFYRCRINGNNVYLVSHGTYLQVFKPMEKTINLSESTKNKILTAEGVLLLLCVLVPSFTILLQSKKLNQLEKRKEKLEEENIYQGLNMDDCQFTYDQIERSQVHDPYQDVENMREGEEEIQLEKP